MKRIEDPIGLLPAKLILGINKRGVHFFRPVPKEYLHSAELRDIMQFGSSSQAVFFKMRVAGVLHIFQFDTKQGEDICMALQTHINDIMMKRYSKVCRPSCSPQQRTTDQNVVCMLMCKGISNVLRLCQVKRKSACMRQSFGQLEPYSCGFEAAAEILCIY